ncbi:hypothetical protein [Nocardioides sp.]|jgi:hypothetical protein|uniref:hypothetical protein n=1 Tax=Nocardioides sp. TaxID=35761 RepID=UPI002F41FCA7
MKRVGWFGLVCLLLVSASGCKVHRPSLSDDGPERGCTPPKLTVVGHAGKRGPLTVHPGQTLRLRGIHFTDDCAAGGAGTGRTIPRLQLVLQSKYRIGPLATVHPHGASSAFTVAVRIPPTTATGPAKIFDTAGSVAGGIRLVVRP